MSRLIVTLPQIFVTFLGLAAFASRLLMGGGSASSEISLWCRPHRVVAAPGVCGGSMQELLIGDRTPDLRLADFLKGEPLSQLELGKVYVLEFWATWCGPCRTSVPHLSDLQEKYPQVIFIGVTAYEPNIDAVKAFVEKMGDQIRYRIAIEESLAGRAGWEGGWMTKHWLEAGYQRGIPAAFIVNQTGQIAWIGHPIELDDPLAAIINGSWDLSTKAQAYGEMLAKNKVRERFRLDKGVSTALAENDTAGAVRLINEAFAAHPEFELEGRFWINKLHALTRSAESKPLALKYAEYLIDLAGQTDIELLRSVSIRLLDANRQSGEAQAAAPDSDFAELAVLAMRRVELLSAQESPSDTTPGVWMLFEMYFARGLLAIGLIDEALDHAQRAHRWGKEASAPDEVLARIALLEKQCHGSI
ncbi:MAG TPA: TlpA disulfide reductase family protein [Methylocella sp.]|nr:TlpA disulfide reductase family protein [Methylocella sp.]